MQRLNTYFDRSSIGFRLFRLVVLVATASLGISMAVGTLYEWRNQQNQLRQSLDTITQAVGVAASAAVAFHDKKAAGEALQILRAHSQIKEAALYHLEGYRLASYGEAARLPDNTDQLQEHQPDFGLSAPATTLFQPILLDHDAIGFIFIRTSLRTYQQKLIQQVVLSVGISLLALLLVLGLGLRFLDRIVKPVKELADTSRQVRVSRNFSLRTTPPVSGGHQDEIDELIVDFNAMLAEIEARERELANYHQHLESMVLERTAALSVANRNLLVAKEAAEAATLAKSRFLAAASHDLRQPIQAINLFQNALNATDLNAEQQRISNYLSLSAQSLGEVLDILLDISKLDTGAVTASPQAIDVHDLLSGMDAAFTPLAAAKSLSFRIYFPSSKLSLFVDDKLLRSLLNNLLGNALKYTERGSVLLAIRRRGDQAIIQVWDTGIGIAPQHLETIFDEYFQVGNTERDKEKGLGLGLSVVKRLATLLNTKIVCRSRLGKGSVFEFVLPLADPAQTH